MNPHNPESGFVAPQEATPRPLEVVVIDQDNPNYPYKASDDPLRLTLIDDIFGFGSPVSHEGFYHNDEAHRNAGRQIAFLLNLPQDSKVIDVGWGRNSFISEGLKSSGLDVSLIDYAGQRAPRDPEDPLTVPPIRVEDHDNGLHEFVGNIADISHPSSVLKDTKFDLTIFNGSYISGGYNNTISESLEARLQQKYGNNFPGYDDPRVIADLDEYRFGVLRSVTEHINQGGFIYFGSSRFAYHGAGYDFDDYPREKIDQLDVMTQMVRLGAKKVIVVGMTDEKLRQVVDFNLTDPDEIDRRASHAIHKLIFPSLGGSKAEFTLTNASGTPLKYEELESYTKDPEKKAKLLQNPDIATRVEEAERKTRQNAEIVYNQLSGGASSLPDTFRFSSLHPTKRLQRIKKEAEGLIPKDIARIDALAFQF